MKSAVYWLAFVSATICSLSACPTRPTLLQAASHRKAFKIEPESPGEAMEEFRAYANLYDNLEGEYAISTFRPEGYALGPMLTIRGGPMLTPLYWYAGLNYRKDYLSQPPDAPATPAVLQVWQADRFYGPLRESYIGPFPLQQFEAAESIIQEMGFLNAGNDQILYVITQQMNLNSILSCFRIQEDGEIALISQEECRSLTWRIDLKDYGPCFATFYFHSYGEYLGDWKKDFIALITCGGDGFYIRQAVDMGDILTAEENTCIENADQFRAFVTYKLMVTNEWKSHLYPCDCGVLSRQRDGSQLPESLWATNVHGWREVSVGSKARAND